PPRSEIASEFRTLRNALFQLTSGVLPGADAEVALPVIATFLFVREKPAVRCAYQVLADPVPTLQGLVPGDSKRVLRRRPGLHALPEGSRPQQIGRQPPLTPP